jgi:hypothetical protein
MLSVGNINFTRATQADAFLLESGLRSTDRSEIDAASGPDHLRTIALAVEHSALPITARDSSGSLLCMFGVVPSGVLKVSGVPWLLGTDKMSGRACSLVRLGRVYLEDALTIYRHLHNYVDARNMASIAWLRALGFTVRPSESFGVAGLPFHPFDMRRNDVRN